MIKKLYFCRLACTWFACTRLTYILIILINLNCFADKKIYVLANSWGNILNCKTVNFLKNKLETLGYSLEQVGSIENLPEFELLLCFDRDFGQEQFLHKYSPEKLVLFMWEPPVVYPHNYDKEFHKYFSKIITYSDDLVDNKKYFKFYGSVWLTQMQPGAAAFKDKKLCTMITRCLSSNHPQELYSARRKMIEFFETCPSNSFDLYGLWWSYDYKNYKGPVDCKYTCLKNYKFSICYENTKNFNGYITEKIWDSFVAGCVPIYLGPDNVTDYIPENCFIPAYKFNSPKEIYEYISNMTEETYNKYIENIENYLQTPEARKFSPEYFPENIINIILPK